MPRFLHLVAVIALSSCACVAADQSSKDQASKLAAAFDSHYNSVRTLRADFTENYSGSGISRQESGTLTLKKPGKMRWDYREPHSKLFLSDGKNAFFYVPGERQARRASVKKLDDLRSPLRYLLGKSKLERELNNLHVDSTAKPTTAGNIVLAGIPKGLEDRASQVKLEITPEGRLTAITLDELDGSHTEFHFRNMTENQDVPDSSFRFVPPSGVEVMEAQELNQ